MSYFTGLKRAVGLVALLAIVLVSMPANAGTVDWSVNGAHVTVVEGSYMPGFITFQIDAAVGPCPAGSWLIWNGQGSTSQSQQDNNKAVYALLITALATGKAINLYGNNPSASGGACLATYVH